MIRRANKNDIVQIMDLLLQVCMVHHRGRPDLFKAGGAKYTDNQLLDILNDEKTPVFVYTNDDDKVLGYAFCIFKQLYNDNILTDIKTLYIDDLCVNEENRGQSIGKQLYDFVYEYAKQNSCYNLTLNVWSCNKSALAFYEKCGLMPQKIGMEVIL